MLGCLRASQMGAISEWGRIILQHCPPFDVNFWQLVKCHGSSLMFYPSVQEWHLQTAHWACSSIAASLYRAKEFYLPFFTPTQSTHFKTAWIPRETRHGSHFCVLPLWDQGAPCVRPWFKTIQGNTTLSFQIGLLVCSPATEIAICTCLKCAYSLPAAKGRVGKRSSRTQHASTSFNVTERHYRLN